MTDTLIILSFIAGLVPTAIFLLSYGIRTKWAESSAGRFLFAMAFTTTVSYSVSLVTLLIPDYFNGTEGEWIRIIIRFMLAAVSWSLLYVFFRAQKAGNRRRHRADTPERRKSDVEP
jgi:hypothetical protein